ncbi:hypothetical protein L2E82_11708 [Cichorium intybus]|uniref:Uncharacterized protein n=1 Tax=Cichorium intybus TaxID=13427 RepID=A0ACB9GDY0_CICIN|nr:hypothetical protein L2E82_11708 [Cichorium intybus]
MKLKEKEKKDTSLIRKRKRKKPITTLILSYEFFYQLHVHLTPAAYSHCIKPASHPTRYTHFIGNSTTTTTHRQTSGDPPWIFSYWKNLS